jgi:hypothetical protein
MYNSSLTPPPSRRTDLSGPDPETPFESLRGAWRRGDSLPRLFGPRPLAIDDRVGAQAPNRRGDVAKVEALLHRAGYYDLAPMEGPTGYYGSALGRAITRFQSDRGLAPDGTLYPEGETIRTLASTAGADDGPASQGVGRIRGDAAGIAETAPDAPDGRASPEGSLTGRDVRIAAGPRPAPAPARPADPSRLTPDALAAIIYNETSSLRETPGGSRLQEMRDAMGHAIVNRYEQGETGGHAEDVLSAQERQAIFQNKYPPSVAAYAQSMAAAKAALSRAAAPTTGGGSAFFFNGRPDNSTLPNTKVVRGKTAPFIATFGPYDNVYPSKHMPRRGS